jgi:hypothetical protein
MESAMESSSESENMMSNKKGTKMNELSIGSITETPEERAKREKDELIK